MFKHPLFVSFRQFLCWECRTYKVSIVFRDSIAHFLPIMFNHCSNLRFTHTSIIFSKEVCYFIPKNPNFLMIFVLFPPIFVGQKAVTTNYYAFRMYGEGEIADSVKEIRCNLFHESTLWFISTLYYRDYCWFFDCSLKARYMKLKICRRHTWTSCLS